MEDGRGVIPERILAFCKEGTLPMRLSEDVVGELREIADLSDIS